MQVEILGVRTEAQTFPNALERLLAWAGTPQARRYVSTCTAYTAMQCHDNPAVARAVNGADMITADGMPIVWVQQRLGYPPAERIYGPDLMLALCDQGRDHKLRHFFLGGSEGVAAQLAQVLQSRFEGLQVVGVHTPPHEDTIIAPDASLVERLNAAQADIIWVGLGSPKQDTWMSLYRPLLDAPLLIGVGAAFDFLSGAKKQAPRWMQRIGMEWAFRLWQEPRRLGRRYLIYNPRFIWAVWRAHFS